MTIRGFLFFTILALLVSGQALAWTPVDDVIDRGPQAGELRYNQLMRAEVDDHDLTSAARLFLATSEGRRLQQQLGTEGAFTKVMATNLSLTMRHQKLVHFPNVIWKGDVPIWTPADVTIQPSNRYLIVVGKDGLQPSAGATASQQKKLSAVKKSPVKPKPAQKAASKNNSSRPFGGVAR